MINNGESKYRARLATEWSTITPRTPFFRLNDTRLSFTHFCHFVAQIYPIVEIAKWHFCQTRCPAPKRNISTSILDLEFCYSYYKRHSFDEQFSSTVYIKFRYVEMECTIISNQQLLDISKFHTYIIHILYKYVAL